jgi:porin
MATNEKRGKFLPTILVAIGVIAVVGAIGTMVGNVGGPTSADAAGTPRHPAPYVFVHEEPIASAPPSPATQPATEEATTTTPAPTEELKPAKQGVAPAAPPAATESVAEAAPEATHLTQDLIPRRSQLENKGVAFDLSLATYFGGNFFGGAFPNSGGASEILNFNVTLDSQKLLGYAGGTFFVNLKQEDGLHTSRDGSFGETSSLYEPDLTQVSELWYQQLLADDKVRVKLGKIDANTEFAGVQNGADFLNDFATFPATILSFPTDPNPAFGACAFFNPNDNLYAQIGVFDGSAQEGVTTGSVGPVDLVRGPNSVFSIVEAGFKWTLPGARAGRVGVGGWYHSGEFARLDGSGSDNGASGPYATFDQTLWKKYPDQDDDNQGITMFAMLGYADPEISPVQWQFATGATWTGAIPNRTQDALGVGMGYIEFSDAPGSGFEERDEITIETFYKIHCNGWLSVQPDIQYVHNSGGLSSNRDTLAAVVQILIDL